MVALIDRSIEARESRTPDLFLSHSSRDKDAVRRIAEDLGFLEVDAWLDEWELQAGDSLYDVISAALEKASHVAVVIGDNYADSRWARDELKQARARERRRKEGVIIPLVCGSAPVPPFIEDRVYLDLTITNYYAGVSRLAAIVHGVSRMRIEEAISIVQPKDIANCVKVLRYCGVEPYMIVGRDDWLEIEACGGSTYGDRLRFSPEKIAAHPNCSPRIRRLMKRLTEEVWNRDAWW
jgi:TIR domain-containing protein